jgi:hypothetical protein
VSTDLRLPSPDPPSRNPVLTTSLALTPTVGGAGLRLELHLAADVDVPYVQRRLLELVEELNDELLGDREEVGRTCTRGPTTSA